MLQKASYSMNMQILSSHTFDMLLLLASHAPPSLPKNKSLDCSCVKPAHSALHGLPCASCCPFPTICTLLSQAHQSVTPPTSLYKTAFTQQRLVLGSSEIGYLILKFMFKAETVTSFNNMPSENKVYLRHKTAEIHRLCLTVVILDCVFFQRMLECKNYTMLQNTS